MLNMAQFTCGSSASSGGLRRAALGLGAKTWTHPAVDGSCVLGVDFTSYSQKHQQGANQVPVDQYNIKKDWGEFEDLQSKHLANRGKYIVRARTTR